MIVSPERLQVVVVAVASKDNGFQSVVAFASTFKNKLVPFALFSWIVLPIVKYPDEASGPRVGIPLMSWRYKW